MAAVSEEVLMMTGALRIYFWNRFNLKKTVYIKYIKKSIKKVAFLKPKIFLINNLNKIIQKLTV